MRNTKRWLAVALSGFLALQSGVPVFAEETSQDSTETVSAEDTGEPEAEEAATAEDSSMEESEVSDDTSTEGAVEEGKELSDEEDTGDAPSDEAAAEESDNTDTENSVENSTESTSDSTESETEISPAETSEEEIAEQSETHVYYSVDGETYSELSVQDGSASVDFGTVEIPFDVWLRIGDNEAQKSTVSEAGTTVLSIGEYKVTVTAKGKDAEETKEQSVITYSVNGGAYQEVAFDEDGNAVVDLGELNAIPYTINFRVDGESAKDYAPDSESFVAEVDGHKITLKASVKKTEDRISYTVNGNTISVDEENAQDDGSYLIELPEDTNFPLQITFTVNGEDQVVEFAASDSTVEVAGKTFRLHVAEKKTHTLTYNNGWYDQEIYLDEKRDDGTWLIRMNSTDISYPTEVTFNYDGKEYKHTFTSEDDIFEIGAYRVKLEVPFMYYNTGNSKEAAYASDMEDGAYKIWLGQDPFFPFEVQITCNGATQNYWFKNPGDSFEINGRRIEASEYFTGDVITQMSLEVGGKEIVVYPEEKEFKDSAMVLFSMYYPIEEKQLDTVDLSGITPVELTQVKVTNVFTGENALTSGQSLVFRNTSSNMSNYTVGSVDGTVDLSDNISGGTAYYEMIVGTPDQLDSSNIRYKVPINTSSQYSWLTFSAASDTEERVRTTRNVTETYIYKSDEKSRTSVYVDSFPYEETPYLSCTQNTSVFPNAPKIRVFEGLHTSADDAQKSTEITDQLIGADMSSAGSGYQMERYEDSDMTFVSYDANGNVTGCLPRATYLTTSGSSTGLSINFSLSALDSDNKYTSANYSSTWYVTDNNGLTKREFDIYREFSASQQLSLSHAYLYGSDSDTYEVTSIYEGLYDTVAAAKAAGAADITAKVTADDAANGYFADFSGGKNITVFVSDGSAETAHKFNIVAKQGTKSRYSGYSEVPFTGLVDKDGNSINCWLLNSDYSRSDDSYAEGNYVTYFVDDSTDVSNLAPTFWLSDGLKLYRTGSSTSIESGKDFADFSGEKAVQYTSSAANGEGAKNYWVRVLKAVDGQRLFVTSLIDENAGTTTENGVTTSTREVLLDSTHYNIHNIFVANLGKDDIPNLKVELQSDTLKLDSFLTLTGNNNLEGFDSLATTSEVFYDHRAKNAAQVRLLAKDGTDSGSTVDGTLTFSSNGTTLLVLKLTGTIGSPQIITKDIPNAVKYVPYGTMIQNNNKYSNNTITYSLEGGSLPDGMTLKPNGEIYGVPKENGTFTFQVKMTNSRRDFSDVYRRFTLTVLDNTNTNVDNATDADYYLIDRLPDTVNDDNDSMLRSNGVLGEYKAVYLDGEKLTEGTDYDATSGSTRITLKKQTLQKVGEGKHTIGIEFRKSASSSSENKTDGDLKKAAQNFNVKRNSSSNNNNNSGSNSGSSSNNSSSSSSSGSSSSGSSSSSSTAASSASTGRSRATKGSKASNQNTQQNQETPSTNVTTSQNPILAMPVLYTVTRGDTLRKISQKFFGTENYWEKIFNDNRDVLRRANRIYPNQVLKLYAIDLGDGTYLYPSEDGGSVVPAVVTNTTSETTPQEETKSTPDASSAEENQPVSTTYVVVRGDSLSRISRRVYGNAANWRRIYDANRDKISNPNMIYPGQNLTIPQCTHI